MVASDSGFSVYLLWLICKWYISVSSGSSHGWFWLWVLYVSALWLWWCLFTWGFHVSHCLVMLVSSSLSMWPCHLHFPDMFCRFINSCPGFSQASSFLVLSCCLMFRCFSLLIWLCFLPFVMTFYCICPQFGKTLWSKTEEPRERKSPRQNDWHRQHYEL